MAGFRSRPNPASRPSRGFTLVELMLVMAVIAIATGIAALALRDPAASRLEREGARLAALLEAARAEARAGGFAVVWRPGALSADGRPDGADFRFVGLPAATVLPTRWLEPGVEAQVVGATTLSLGPEPMIGPQRVVLETDGLGPFRPADGVTAAAP